MDADNNAIPSLHSINFYLIKLAQHRKSKPGQDYNENDSENAIGHRCNG